MVEDDISDSSADNLADRYRVEVAGSMAGEAKDRMAEVLAVTPMQVPSSVVWSNVTAGNYEGMSVDEIRSTLVSQITSPVRWAGQLAKMVEAGYDQWIELAPGKVLRGLMRRIDRSVKVQNHDQPDATVSA